MWSTPSDDLTPMLAQYHALKQQYSDCLLFFRLGDFYELFYEDAQIGSKELGLVLTSRPAGKGKERIPMCGVPYHSASSYISRLVSKGYKVALCEQLEDASQAKGIVRRDVIRVITPGTYFEKEVCGVAAVYVKNKKHHCAYLNPSTGEFVAGSFSSEGAQEFLLKFSPKELLVLPNYPTEKLQKILKVFINPIKEEDVEEGYRLLKEDMGVYHPTALGFEEEGPLYACGVLYRYLKITQKGFMPLVGRPKPYSDEGYVRIDYRTRRGLELIESYEGREDLSLLGVIDRTLTSMGRRLLRFYLLHPFGKREKILKVQEAVEELLKDRELLKDVREVLEGMPDLERLVSRISGNVATPRDLVLLKKAAEKVSKLKALLMERAKSQLLRELAEKMEDLEDLRRDIDNTLVEDPPLHVKEGGLIKEGVNPTLDELRSIKEKGEQILREYEDRLRRETGINSLKIGFNKVMGYYIEVTKPNLRFVPSYFKRRQTLSSGERFTTQELETLEEKLLSADVRIKELEYQLFLQLRERVLEKLPAVSSTASPVAHVDYLQSLAYVALQKGWIKPQMVEEPVLHIEEGRHPVVEAYVKDFVPNDTHMDESSFVYIITGPNMAGKSSYIRQVALLTLLAHMGSFLPCRSARIGIVSSIHARVGSGDVLALGISTFMNEMLEVAGILSSADRRSLIVLDEVGRGTSTHDGIAISKAIVEYIVRKIGARTLVATHYTELTELEDKLPHVVNYHMAVSRDGSQIKFLYRLRRGKAEASLGIYVAKMAGLPQEVVNRAQELLSEPILEKVYEKSQEEEAKRLTEEILRLIEGIDIATTTPLDALITLARLKEMVKNIRYTHKW